MFTMDFGHIFMRFWAFVRGTDSLEGFETGNIPKICPCFKLSCVCWICFLRHSCAWISSVGWNIVDVGFVVAFRSITIPVSICAAQHRAVSLHCGSCYRPSSPLSGRSLRCSKLVQFRVISLSNQHVKLHFATAPSWVLWHLFTFSTCKIRTVTVWDYLKIWSRY